MNAELRDRLERIQADVAWVLAELRAPAEGIQAAVEQAMEVCGTQAELAKRLGVSENTITGWRRHARTPLRAHREAIHQILVGAGRLTMQRYREIDAAARRANHGRPVSVRRQVARITTGDGARELARQALRGSMTGPELAEHVGLDLEHLRALVTGGEAPPITVTQALELARVAHGAELLEAARDPEGAGRCVPDSAYDDAPVTHHEAAWLERTG